MRSSGGGSDSKLSSSSSEPTARRLIEPSAASMRSTAQYAARRLDALE
jgi:hypothetical protein